MVRRIMLDPGHGGQDPGAVGYGVQEKAVALAVARRTADILRAHGLEVRMTREKDETLSLSDRVRMANEWPADRFVSIHCNAAPNSQANGFEVWHSYLANSPGRQLAQAIAEELDQLTPLTPRGLKTRKNQAGRDYLYVIRETRMAAVLVECAFVSNPQDAAYLRKPEGQEALAQGIARGILRHVGKVPSKESSPVKETWPDWARDSIKRVQARGWMRGYTDGTFRPNEPVSRAQLAVILDRLGQDLDRLARQLEKE